MSRRGESGPSSRTLRHLLFATDAWVKRAILGDPSPWDRLDLPHDEMPEESSVPRDRGARPSLDEVLALRADRVATVRQVLADLTDAKLGGMTEPVTEPGYPELESCTPNGTSTCSSRGRPDPWGRMTQRPSRSSVTAWRPSSERCPRAAPRTITATSQVDRPFQGERAGLDDAPTRIVDGGFRRADAGRERAAWRSLRLLIGIMHDAAFSRMPCLSRIEPFR